MKGKNMYAIVSTGGKQYKVATDDVITGENVGRGKDDTLFALVEGKVKFTKGLKHRVNVYPVEA